MKLVLLITIYQLLLSEQIEKNNRRIDHINNSINSIFQNMEHRKQFSDWYNSQHFNESLQKIIKLKKQRKILEFKNTFVEDLTIITKKKQQELKYNISLV